MTDSPKTIDLDNIIDDELLNLRISDLPITIEGTWLNDCISDLYKELEKKGLNFKPECYLADEWLTPEKETCIGIPFYLAHPTLIRLEKKFMIDAEGEGKDWCMKLLRHETGHAICYAYRFHKRKQWRRMFGSPTAVYADTYKYRPYSRNFVRHLEGYYAQYHPDEDFVETFAVWLTPGLDWENKYKGWKALDKLRYVDRLMQEIQGKDPPVKNNQKFWRLSTLRLALKNYYKKKRRFWEEEFPDFHDAYLLRNFQPRGEENRKLPLVSDVIRRYQRQVITNVSRYSREKKYIINDVIKSILKRSRQLKLVAADDDAVVVVSLSSYVTALSMNYLYTGRFRGLHHKRGSK